MTGYSARVKLTLTIGDEELEVAQTGPDFIIMRDRVNRPPCKGTLTIEVDGVPTRYDIFLTNGINGDVTKTPYERAIYGY